MTSVEIIESVAQKARMKKVIVAHLINLFFEEMTDALNKGETVQLRRFGTLSPTVLKPMSYFGGKQTAGLRTTVKFKTSRRSRWRSSESPTKKKQ